jgi:hypothetical protein
LEHSDVVSGCLALNSIKYAEFKAIFEHKDTCQMRYPLPSDLLFCRKVGIHISLSGCGYVCMCLPYVNESNPNNYAPTKVPKRTKIVNYKTRNITTVRIQTRVKYRLISSEAR